MVVEDSVIISERALPMADTAKVPPALYPVANGTQPPSTFLGMGCVTSSNPRSNCIYFPDFQCGMEACCNPFKCMLRA